MISEWVTTVTIREQIKLKSSILSTTLAFAIYYTRTSKCYNRPLHSFLSDPFITRTSLYFLAKESGSGLSSNLGPFAPQWHALPTVPLPLKNQYFYLKSEAEVIGCLIIVSLQ